MLIVDNSKPVVFLGSCVTMEQYTDICYQHGISVAGIFDSDYFGNTADICGVPVIGTEKWLLDNSRLPELIEKYNFFCAINWIPVDDEISRRNRDKRHAMLALIDNLSLPCVSLISKNCVISPSAQIGKGCFVSHFSVVEPNVVLGDHSGIHVQCFVGFDTIIGRNCVLNRQAAMSAKSIVGDDSYFSPIVKVAKEGITIGARSWIQEGIYLRRGTLPGEVVSLHEGNRKRVYQLLVE